jgi:hypothetical protein
VPAFEVQALKTYMDDLLQKLKDVVRLTKEKDREISAQTLLLLSIVQEKSRWES